MRTADFLTRSVRLIEGDDRLDRVADPVDDVAARVGGSPAGPALRGEWLGHALHPLLTDLPLGMWLSAGVLDVLGGRSSRTAARRLVGLGLTLVPATALAGAADYDRMDEQPARRVGVVHAVGNGAVALMYLMSWRQRRRGHHLRGVAYGMTGGLLAVATGYLGGHLAFGTSDDRGDRDELAASRLQSSGSGHSSAMPIDDPQDVAEQLDEDVTGLVSGAVAGIDVDDEVDVDETDPAPRVDAISMEEAAMHVVDDPRR